MERDLLALAPAAILAAGYVVCFAVILGLRKEVGTLRSQFSRRDASEIVSAMDLKKKLEDVQQRLGDAEERAGTLAPPSPISSGFNFSKRSQAVRLSRRGEPIASIAASLRIPRRQVELLLKVQGMGTGSGASSTTS